MARGKKAAPTALDIIARGGRVNPSDLAGIPLGDHDGVPITQFAANLIKAGDGLSEGFKLDPLHLPIGAELAIVVVGKVVSHEYDYAKDGRQRIEDERKETAIIEAEGALIVDPDLVSDVADAHMKRIRDAREAEAEAKRVARGELRLEGMERPTSINGADADASADDDEWEDDEEESG